MRRNLSCYCLLTPCIHIFVLCAHPVRGESHNQRNATGEVATVLNAHLCFVSKNFWFYKNFEYLASIFS